MSLALSFNGDECTHSWACVEGSVFDTPHPRERCMFVADRRRNELIFESPDEVVELTEEGGILHSIFESEDEVVEDAEADMEGIVEVDDAEEVDETNMDVELEGLRRLVHEHQYGEELDALRRVVREYEGDDSNGLL